MHFGCGEPRGHCGWIRSSTLRKHSQSGQDNTASIFFPSRVTIATDKSPTFFRQEASERGKAG